MIQSNTYTDLDGRVIALNELDAEERKLVAGLKRRANTHPDWYDYENYWTQAVWEFYRARGLTRKQALRTPVYRIAQDLSSRIAIEQGLARMPDFRDELEDLIRTRFKSQREFCEATGLSEDMLSHVLAGRKNLSIDALETALARIGCTLRIMPLDPAASDE